MNPTLKWTPLAYELLDRHYSIGGYRAVQEGFVADGMPPSTFSSIKVKACLCGVKPPATRPYRPSQFDIDVIGRAHLEVLAEIRDRRHRRRFNVATLVARPGRLLDWPLLQGHGGELRGRSRETRGADGGDVMNMISRLLRCFRPLAGDDRVVIDQTAYFDRLHDERRRQQRIAAEADKHEWGVAKLARNWASATIKQRRRPALPGKLPRTVCEWLPGLQVQELMKLSTAGIVDVQHHVFGGEKIAGVRPVQPLAGCALVFPKPVLDPHAQRVVQRF